MAHKRVRAGTRGSALALWQTEFVLARLALAWPQLTHEIVTVTSRGDRDKTTPLPQLGGKGLFTAELEEGLRSGRIDIAVHSLKDLPIEDPAGLTSAAILAREEVRDVLISRGGQTLEELPPNAIIGTSSVRRRAQILARRPDVWVQSIRGNVDTRLRKLDEGQYDAIVLAGAGIVRMGLVERVTEWLPVEWFVPAPGQGALAVQCRADDSETRTLLAAIHEPALAAEVMAERQFLAGLGGGCAEPVGAYATGGAPGTGGITMRAWFSRPHGQLHWVGAQRGREPGELARAMARKAGETIISSRNVSHSHIETTPEFIKVALTRPYSESLDGSRLLLQQNMQPVIMPVLRIEEILSPQVVRATVDDPGTYGWLVFTSATAVRAFAGAWRAGGGEIGDWAHVPVAAVGPATAKAANEAGFGVHVVPDSYLAQHLLAALPDLSSARMLFPRSAAGRPEIVEALRARAASVLELPLYQPVPCELDDYAVRALAAGVDYLTFCSGSAVRAFVAAVKAHPALQPLFTQAAIACIGPQTAAVARELGLPVALVSPVHTMEGLVDALAADVVAKVIAKQATENVTPDMENSCTRTGVEPRRAKSK